MKRFLLIGMVFLCAFSTSFAQIPLATQGFESGDTWTYTSNPEFYDFNNGDAFDIMSGEYQTMVATTGNSFLAFHDIVNPNAPLLEGQTNSYYYHYLTFATIQIPQPSPADLKLSFSYLAHQLDGTDYMAYELQFNNDDTWNSDWVSSVDTSFAFSAYLSKNTDDLWVTHTIDIPDTVSFVRFRIGAYQNGGSDWGGFDDFSLFFDSAGDFVAPNVEDASITSDQTIVLTFDEAIQSASVSIADYGISSSTLSEDGLQMTLNLSSNLADGDFFDITVDALTDLAGNQSNSVLENLVHNDFVGSLVITEINYNDPGPYDNLDYFEIYNNGDEAYPLGGLAFIEGVNVNFPEYSLAAGEYVIVAQPAYFLNDACGALPFGCGFQSYFGFAPTFEIASGYLGAGLLQCVNTVGDIVISADFDYSGDWPANANGNGYSIVLCDPSSDMNLASNWALSSSIQYAVSPEDSVLTAMGLSGFTQYYADPGGPCAVGDILPPAVVNIYAVDASTVVVVYDEAIAVDGTYDGLSVASSTISGDTATLSLSTPLELAVIYSVTISGTQDADGNSTLSYGVEVFYNTVSNLFISEFAEGSSNNKYIEIYNASDNAVDLSFYGIANTSNAPTTVGVYEYWTDFPEGATIASQGTYIITHGSADSAIASVSDMTYNYLSNGDDGFALVYGNEPTIPVDPETGGYTIVDFAGDWNGDPGSGWTVAGVSNATQNHTLIRKCSVEQGNSDWAVSAGTSAEDSEWIVLEIDDWSNLDQHETPCPDIILGCTDEAASNYNSTATEDDGSCEYLGCTDETAVNFDSSAVTDDGSCVYPLDPMVNLFISEYSEGSSSNKYLEIYNPTADTVSLASYAWPSVSNAPSTVGAYEYWNSFAAGAQIAPYGVYVVANPSSDLAILNYADETGTVYFNGDDGYALVYGFEPNSPSTPEVGGYVVLDIVGDWNGDPGSGWEVAGVANGTKDHTLVRKCSVEQGNANDWTTSAGTNADDSEWIVLEQNDWSNLGMHTSPCPIDAVFGCTDPVACNFDDNATDDDGSCETPNDCGSCEGDLSCLVTVTVSVDMSVEGFTAGDGSTFDGLDGSSMAIRLNGGSWVAMTDMGDNVWTTTFSVAPNSSHVYNFNDGWYESGSFGDCAGGNFGNDRMVTVADVDMVVPTVCWESCEACPEVILGCTDSEASNYDAAATEDDGSCTYPAPMVSLFYSEYAEGSSNNKYFEIYNPSSDVVNLSDYTYNNCSNDCDGWEYSTSFAEGAIIPAGGTYSVCHPSFTGDQSLCDELTTLYFNGNDAQGLLYVPTGEVLDVIGDTIGGAEYWSVAGVSSGTKDHTLVRKCSIEQGNSDWASSAGTNADDSEWVVLEQNDWSDLGMHTAECPTVVLGCTDSTANNFNELATEDDGSCDYTVISYYSLTVSVDMSVEGFVVGDGSTWDGLDGSSMAIRLDGGSWVAMTDMGDNVWSHTFTDLLAGDYTYNFNDGWYESGPFGDCVGGQYGNDRLATIVDMDVTVPTVCWESCEACPEVVLGCTDETASNYDATATEDDGSCTYPAPMANLFYSEYAEGSSNNKYLEIYNPSDVTVSLADYGYPSVSNAPSTVGEYEYWNSFDEGAEIAPNGVYIVAHGSSDSLILALANETHNYLSNGDDGYALAYGNSDDYVIIDHIGDFNGDPGSGWEVAGVSNATKDHTLVRKCSVESGNTDWVASAGTDADDSEWIVLEQDDWSDLGEHNGECTTPLLLVNFTVDMSTTSQPNMIDYDNVVINGTWNGWQGWGVTLSDEDGDNIWTGSGEFDPAIGQFEYVVAVTGPTDGYSGWGMQWENCDGSNFMVVFEEGVTSYDANPDLDCPEPTVFNVDMSCSGIEFTTVHLTGPIWGWTTDIIMTDEDGDGIYSITMDGLEGDVEYKYMVDYWAGQEDLIDDMVNGATCAPITDYSSYANRQVAAGTTTSDTYGSCDECGAVITGCTDEAASNYNPAATEDDGSCDYCDDVTVNFSVDASEWIGVVIGYQNVVINGSFANWNGWGVELTDADGDGIWTGSTTVDANVTHEYVHALTGTADWYSGWGIIGYAPEACQLGISEATGDASPNYYFSGECGEVIDLPTVCFGSCVGCVEEVLGCTDASADNYDPNANTDDGSCTFCSSFEAVLLGTSDASAAGSSDGSVQATGQGGSNDYSVSVVDGDGVPQNPFALAAGDYTAVVTDVTSGCEASVAFSISEPVVADNPCDIVPTGLFVDNIIHNRITFNWSAPSAAPSHYMIRYRVVGTSSWTVMTAGPVNSNEFNGTSRTRYFMEAGTTYEWSMRARVLNEDGSTNCQSSWSANSEYTTLPACANLENLSVDNVEANWVTFYADAPAAEWGVWQSKGKMRAVGSNAYRYVNGDSDGAISGVLKGNFTASTDYEWHTKSWCTGNVDANGDSDPQYHSGWGDFSAFSTEAPCDKMPTNLTTTSNGANTAVIMSWDTPASGAPDHYFLEMTNLTTGNVYEWNYQDGNSNSRTKFGQNPGDEISWRIRGACGTNGTSWATIFSQPVTYTLGGARLENSSVANLDVYPNPSRDIFNVTFTSEEAQTMTVKVVNMIGEEVFTEELTEFVGQYTQVIDMNTQPKGVYFLEITTSTGGINKKIVLQ